MAQIKRHKKKPLRKTKAFPPFPKPLSEKLENFFDGINNSQQNNKIAIFDLDNTLLLNSISEAAIAYLLENEIDIKFKWSEYEKLKFGGSGIDAYTKASQSFAGMEDSCIKRFADVVLNNKDEFITFFEGAHIIKVPVPKINPHLKQIVELLKNNEFQIYIIAPVNQFLLETAAIRFGISKKHCYGIKHKLNYYESIQVLDKQILPPLPFAEEKKKIYRQFISESAPLFTASSSSNDLPLFEFALKNGFILWTGKNQINKNIASSIKCKRILNYWSLF